MSRQEGWYDPNYGPNAFVSPPTSPVPSNRYPNYTGNDNGNQGPPQHQAAIGYGAGPGAGVGVFAPDYTHEKPVGGGPPGYGANNAAYGANNNNMPVYGAAPEKTILGLRRKTFFIIVGVILLLLIVGLGAGLGIALGKKKSSGSVDQSGENGSLPDGISSGSIVSSATFVSKTTPSGPSSTPAGVFPDVSSTTPEFEEPTPTPTPSPTPSPTPEPEEPTTTPYNSPTPDPTPNRTTPTPTPTPTPDDPTTTPAPTAFELETGYNTMELTITSTSGDLCAFVLGNIPLSTTIYPSIVGSAPDDYTAYWQLDNYPGTLVATGSPPEATEDYQTYIFDVTVNSNTNGCASSGEDRFALEEGGLAVYYSGFVLTTDCTSGTYYFPAGEFCEVYWLGSRS